MHPTILSSADFDSAPASSTLFAALLDAQRRFGPGTEILEDVERTPLTFRRLVLGSWIIGAQLAHLTRRGEAAGVLLPNVNGLVVTLFGLNAFGRVAALLNFTAGLRSLKTAVETAEIRTIVSSRRFIGTAKLEDVVAGLIEGGRVRIVYLEDVRKSIGIFDKAIGVLRAAFSSHVHRRHAAKPDDPAVILFTSGTEGLPKGVVLSNRNLLSNAFQISAHAKDALFATDIVMNPLPMFHSFGLTAAGLMPILRGMRTILYPSPLHFRQVASLIASARCTVLFGTDTFMQGYARSAGEGELHCVRVAICGAERVKDATRKLWSKFGTVLLEGYGATECSPVIACNLPDANQPGSVGTLLPGQDVRLDPVDGIAEGGKLSVRGPNVMLGYMRAEQPGAIEPPREGWHDTGDIVSIGPSGHVTIKGRAKRFAKIGGEMVSLAAVEGNVAALWPDSNHVVVSLPDPRKGEVLVLVTEKADAGRDSLLAHGRAQGVPELWVPRTIVVTAKIPVLGSGKVDLPAVMEVARLHKQRSAAGD
jgi:acyl-[acyl-carrier-protein]-phospholipid O-acyltransferase/long-chain-fatty-acid--[acyl-carrier-protein] ligase